MNNKKKCINITTRMQNIAMACKNKDEYKRFMN